LNAAEPTTTTQDSSSSSLSLTGSANASGDSATAESESGVPAPSTWGSALFVQAQFGIIGEPVAPAFGGALGLEAPVLDYLDLAGAIDVAFGRQSGDLADTDLLAVGGTFAALTSIAFESLRLGFGPGFKATWVRLEADPDVAGATGGSVSGLTGGPLMQLRLQVPLDALYLRLGAELGYFSRAIQGVTSDGSDVYGAKGVWLMGFAGIGVHL
jgi:hypothetical protein